MSSFQEISNFIWSVCDDILRGLFKQHEYGDIILPFVVLRRLDCVIEPHKDLIIKLYNDLKSEIDDPSPIIRKQTGLKFYNYSNFDLQRLKGDPKGIKVNFPNYINGYSQNVYEILENFQLQKPVEKLLRNNKLYMLIDKFTEVDLHPETVDNHTMGQIFEELLRKFSEMSNETSGEHYTPRDIVKLLVALVFSESEENLLGEGIIRSLFDPCCGTGGLLVIGKEWIAENIPNEVISKLYGQELNPQTYAICRSDMLITKEDPENIRLGSSLSNDQFEGKTFDYMITNPPFGVSWKAEQDFIKAEKGNPNGRFAVGTPRTSDGSLLFLQHMIAKMKPEGSRIGIILNGSPLFTGDAGSGESEIRRWIIENDWLEAIISLPDQLFFNTGISTYIWILTNNKKPHKKGKIQLINGSDFYQSMKKSLGSKRKYITDEQREEIINIYKDYEASEYCKVFPNTYFGYTKVTIEQPLKEDGEIVTNRSGEVKSDSSLRDYERIPLDEDIETYYNKEVKPHLPDSWMDRSKDKVGYEINFTKYFYVYKPLRDLKEITNDLLALEAQSDFLMNEILDQ